MKQVFSFVTLCVLIELYLDSSIVDPDMPQVVADSVASVILFRFTCFSSCDKDETDS